MAQIDWEWVGGDNKQVQSNYFSKGNTSTYDRGAYHTVSTPLTTTHIYSIEWTSSQVQWIIDGAVVRTLLSSNPEGFPQTPMQVKLGTWCAGGKDTAKGTVEWAGGYTDFSQAPFNAYYKSVKIVDYAGGDSASSKGATAYEYSDKTGSWQSIKVITGGSSDSSSSSAAASSTSATKTKASSTVASTKTTEASSTTEVASSSSSESKTKSKTLTTVTTVASSTAAETTAVSETATAAATVETTTAAAAATTAPSTVGSSAAPHTGVNMVIAAAGLFLAQLIL